MTADVVKRFGIVALATAVAAILTAGITSSHAEEEGIDKAKVEAFDVRMFTKPPGNKAYGCFVRRYDPDHLARHPQQKIGAMKLLVTAEFAPEEKITNYSFRLGLRYRHRSRQFRRQRFLQPLRTRRCRQ